MIGLVVENRLPEQTAVLGFPDASSSSADVVGKRVTSDPGNRGDAIAYWSDVAEVQSLELCRCLLSDTRDRRSERSRQGQNGN
jgi:hypothetical protein